MERPASNLEREVMATSKNAIDAAKAALAPDHPPSAWIKKDDAATITIEHAISSGAVTILNSDDGHHREFVDNCRRFPVKDFAAHGDNLPLEPIIITGCCEHWDAFSSPTESWSIADLVQRLPPVTRLSLDGGPSFARMSLNSSRISMSEYESYCNHTAANDTAPLYLFDPDVLTSKFRNGSAVSDDWPIPECFAHDAMAVMTGSRFRPLPPAWLLVGVSGSGTPIHDHPLFVAWNALLVGCKLWCCFPPDVDESVLQLLGGTSDVDEDEDEEEEDFEFDKSALQWFADCGNLPDSAKIIVQQPGEVAYVPPTWWHVVLNVETSTAICCSLTLRRDIPRLFPPLLQSDEDFARSWLDGLSRQSPYDDDEDVAQALFDLAVVYDDTIHSIDGDGNNTTWKNPEMAATCYARSADATANRKQE